MLFFFNQFNFALSTLFFNLIVVFQHPAPHGRVHPHSLFVYTFNWGVLQVVLLKKVVSKFKSKVGQLFHKRVNFFKTSN